MLEEKLIEVKELVMCEYTRIEKMLEKIERAFSQRSEKILEEVVANDIPRSFSATEALFEQVMALFARYQPEGKQLRTLIMLLKTEGVIEEMAEQMVEVVHAATFLIARPFLSLGNLLQLMRETREMLHDAVTGFLSEDKTLAFKVYKWDITVDDARDELLQNLFPSMEKEVAAVQRGVKIFAMTHALERIGDLSTNIAEETLFVLEGRFIKHTPPTTSSLESDTTNT